MKEEDDAVDESWTIPTLEAGNSDPISIEELNLITQEDRDNYLLHKVKGDS